MVASHSRSCYFDYSNGIAYWSGNIASDLSTTVYFP
jgi:hypothetical protein